MIHWQARPKGHRQWGIYSSKDDSLDVATNLNLDLERFNRDRNSKQAIASIEKDIDIAERSGIRGTPFLVINGRTFVGAVPLSELEKAL